MAPTDPGFSLSLQTVLTTSHRQTIVDFLQRDTGFSHSQEALIRSHAFNLHLCNDTLVGNLLIRISSKNRSSAEEALSVFHHMPNRNIITWNSMIGIYSKRHLHQEAFQIYHQMLDASMEPDQVSFLSLLCSCASTSCLIHGKMIHAIVFASQYRSDININNALINMYGRCGDLYNAWVLFNEMSEKSVVSWNSMISRYVDHGKGKEALEVYHEMQRQNMAAQKDTLISVISACTLIISLEEGRRVHASIIENGYDSDVVLGTGLINLYGKAGCLLDARLVFEKVQEHDRALWTALISAYARQGKGSLQGYPERAFTSNMLGVNDHISASLQEGKTIHAECLEKGVDFDVALGNALLNMYATYGALEEICIVFQKMEQRSIVSWNAVLVAYSHYGAVEVVYHLFSIMYQDGVQPDEVTFVCLLSTCSRGGFLEKAKYAFCCMTRDFNIIPEMEHYNCIIDLVGRAGHLDEAENIIHKIPFEPDIQIWVTFLGVCSLYGDPLGGERAWKRLVHLSPNSTAPHVLLSNIYVTHSKETMT